MMDKALVAKRYYFGVEFALVADNQEEAEETVMEALQDAGFDSIVIWDWVESEGCIDN